MRDHPFPLAGKYHNRRTVGPSPEGGLRTYDSAKEASHAAELAARYRAGDIAAWQTQVTIPLALDGTPLLPFGAHRVASYRADFLVTRSDGGIEIHEVKGYADDAAPATRLWRLKLALVRRMHPDWEIVLV